MAFYGTTQKCKACDTTIHFVEMMSADGIPYHKNCFKCVHCSGRLSMSNYSAIDGNLYCKPHFEQIFKETGSFTSKKLQSPGTQGELSKTPSKVSSFFSGTQEKCAVCKKTVYPLEKVTVESEFYHKSCFRCAHGDGNLYCKPHFAQLFKEKGSYAHLTETTTLKRSASSPESTPDNSVPHQPEIPDAESTKDDE